jgi:hypothetical protein
MLHAGLDLSRRRLDYCLLNEAGERVEVAAAPPDGDGLRGLVANVERRHGPVVRSLSSPVRRLACEFSERPPSCRRAC